MLPLDGLAPFRQALRRWYRRHARPLPWRQTADPYRIWISEIMLQQTTVAAVVPYFRRFIERFPTVQSLAAAPAQEVLRLWEGLGYYSRARNIHRAAQALVERDDGAFPQTVEGLLEYPGIGRYTAGAIVSFAFDRPAPIVEANTLRLYCRLLGFEGDPRTAAGQRLLWSFARQLVPGRAPGEFNQALMELGATVCTPDEPDCPNCPVRRWCAACATNRQASIPMAARRPAVTEVTEVAVAIERDGKYLLRKRPPGERWAGLWDFVRFPVEIPEGATPRRLADRVADQTGLEVRVGELLAELRHGVTRYRITLRCHLARWRRGEPDGTRGEFCWVAGRGFGKLPLSVTGRKLARLLAGAADRTVSPR